MSNPFSTPSSLDPEAGFTQTPSIAQAANDLRAAAGEKAREIVHTAESKATVLKDRAVESAQQFRDTAAEKAAALKSAASEKAQHLKESATEQGIPSHSGRLHPPESHQMRRQRTRPWLPHRPYRPPLIRLTDQRSA